MFKALNKHLGCGIFESMPRRFYTYYELQDIYGSMWSVTRSVVEQYDVQVTWELLKDPQSIQKGGALAASLPCADC